MDFCRVYRADLADLIRTRLVQTNVARRSAGLRVALHAVRKRCPGPVHLIEVGASAGLHLHADRYRYLVGGRVFGRRDAAVTIDSQWLGPGPPPDLDDVPPIASRTGVDLNPLSVTDPGVRLWLRALVWPENQDEADLLTLALDQVAADPPVILPGNAIQVCPELGLRLPPGEPRVVFHAATRMHVPETERAAFDEAIDSLGATGPLYHAWHEQAWAPHAALPDDGSGALALHGPGDRRAVPLARVEGHLRWMMPPAADGPA